MTGLIDAQIACKTFLVVSVRAFLEDISIYIGRPSKADLLSWGGGGRNATQGRHSYTKPAHLL